MELKVENLSKRYGKKNALCKLSFTLSEGVYGLLGPNGAGKSTFMNILTGNVTADSGNIFWNGSDIKKKSTERLFKEQLGYMPQAPVLYRGFTVYEFLNYIAVLKGLEKKQAEEQIQKLLSKLELTDRKRKQLTELSGGMKQRVMLAQAMLGNPKILILDEPTAGLDPKQRIAVRNLIAEIAFDKIVIIATHVVQDVEFISKEILLIEEGQIIEKKEREDLIQKMEGKVFEVRVPMEKYKELQEQYLIGNVVKERDYALVRIVTDEISHSLDFQSVKANLEDVYLYYFRE